MFKLTTAYAQSKMIEGAIDDLETKSAVNLKVSITSNG